MPNDTPPAQDWLSVAVTPEEREGLLAMLETYVGTQDGAWAIDLCERVIHAPNLFSRTFLLSRENEWINLEVEGDLIRVSCQENSVCVELSALRD